VPGLDDLALRDLQIEGGRVRCLVATPALGGLLTRLGSAGITSLVSQPPTLEQLFLRHYDDGEGADR
jgi:ABC-2 type transport system ATP-binding protein